MTNERLLKGAMRYAQLGLRVLPLKPGKKAPATAHGFKDATTNTDMIADWWRDGSQLYNVGIATGAGLVVLDVDINAANDKRGNETLAELEQQHGRLPDTWMCHTGGGGVHYYFRCDDPALTVAAGFAPGLDYRGNGGYVVAPPSVHECGHEYIWASGRSPSDCDLAPLPEWLYELMVSARAQNQRNDEKPNARKTPEQPNARKTTNPEAVDTVTEGGRNDAMFRLASSLRGKGLTTDEIMAAMAVANENRCVPPLPAKELETICSSVGRYDRGVSHPPHPARLVKASYVQYEPPRWVLAPYFQIGKGTLVQGDNGSGKTAFMCAVAAHITTGEPLLGLPVQAPGNVLMLSVEDDLPVLRGRIEADGGDLDKVHFITDAAGLTFNSPEVEAAIKETGAVMVIFDPFQAFLGAKVDMFRSNETRPEMAKLFEMCERNGCACAIIAHMSKSNDRSPVNRALGSVDIPASMRSVMQLTRNPDIPDECIMVHVKCSNAPKGQSIAYSIGDRGGVHWNGFSSMTVEDLTTIVKRKEKRIPYEQDPLVKVFNRLVEERPGGGFWSYADLKSEGAKLLGFPPFSSTADLRQRLDDGLARELQTRSGLIVTHGCKSNGSRGVRVEQYQAGSGAYDF